MAYEDLKYLVKLAESGGPTQEEYGELDDRWPRIKNAVRRGALPAALVRDT